MVALYLFYITIMFYNIKIEGWAQTVKYRLFRLKETALDSENERLDNSEKKYLRDSGTCLIDDEIVNKNELMEYPWQAPNKGCFAYLWWILFLPVKLLFFITIPDVRRLNKNDAKH